MSFGGYFINGNNITVIDQDYSNYALHSIVLIQGDGSGAYGEYADYWIGGWVNNITIPNIQGVIAFTNANVEMTTSQVGTVNSLYKPGSVAGITTSWAPYSYYIAFYVPSSSLPTPSGYALNVYKADGGLAFSSSYRYLKHLVTYNIPDSTLPNGNLTLPYPAGVTGTKIFSTNVLQPTGDHNFQPEGGPFYIGGSAFRAYTDQTNVYCTCDAWYWMGQQQASFSGSAMVYGQANVHIYLGKY